VDILAFNSPDNARSCLVLVNAHAEPRRLTAISGLRGKTAELFLTNRECDMAARPAQALQAGRLSGTLELPAWSVTLLVTQP
jgi:hypothetical protein